MKKSIKLLITFLLISIYQISAQEPKDEDYIEFNDRKNIVHGVYLGFSASYGEIDGGNTALIGFKLAYVANRQFEVGFGMKSFYSQQNLPGISISNDEDLIGAYAGMHLEPILFSKSRVNLSFPLLIGFGVAGYIDRQFNDNDEFDENDYDSDALFVAEPGINLLFNVSRFLQLEAGVKYRFSSKFNIHPSGIDRINGFSAGFGVKVGVFNLGRNRYKKKAPKK
ncbi:hypothetical protein D1818_04635 [Aquimarina sp. BL5]|uniref:hypothetical protein n=1 Tax=Aquimarina sp. BL5 TaxID=1714860 RepID=UPI000E524C69|nr:hypothetical protein [Aquimarina sp. BL5]AXT50150.1 hypothetical protein D1818_04635 [Aquimarina sp. BL5]RKN02080.1 hypothetical protein D7036_16980 [Aquimarina sp. BL5]